MLNLNVFCQNDQFGIANSEDPDQTAPLEKPDVDLHCLPRPICLKTYGHYGNINKQSHTNYLKVMTEFTFFGYFIKTHWKSNITNYSHLKIMCKKTSRRIRGELI